MSIKSILFYTSLLLILSSQSSMLRADSSTPEIDKDRDTAESMVTMRPLLDLDQRKMPLFEFEPKSPIKDYTLMTQKTLDKEEIPGLRGAIAVSQELDDGIANYQFGKRIQFSPDELGSAPEIRDALKEESRKKTLEETIMPYFQSYFFEYNALD